MRKNVRKSEGIVGRELNAYDVIVITGASSGIGEGFVKYIDSFASAMLCNLSRSFPANLSDRENFLNVPCDLQNDEEISSALPKVFDFIKSCGKENPKILLINNSGFGAYGEFPNPSVSRNCDMVDLNVRAVVRLCGEFMPIIIAGKGSIINIASTASFQPCPQLTVYAATKSFVKNFTLGISYELRKRGCKCLCVCPGPTSSNFFRAAGFDTPPLSGDFGHKPSDVAKVTFRALARGKVIVVVGKLNYLQSVLVKFIPIGFLLKISGLILEKVRSAK